MDNRPIGVFDSGVGGMTVLKAMKEKLPEENFIYLGDTKRFPYGSKSKQTIIELTKNGIDFLLKQNVKLVVIACGTATSQALKEVQNNYQVPILGVIEPTVQYIQTKQKTKIGVIATTGTIRSRGWENAILQQIPEAQIQSIACPLLAPMVEEGWTDNKIAKLVVKEYLKNFEKIDALILGCTHYPLLTTVIQKQLGKKVELINAGEHIAVQTQNILQMSEQLADGHSGKIKIYLTETEEKFHQVAGQLLQQDIIIHQVQEETEFI